MLCGPCALMILFPTCDFRIHWKHIYSDYMIILLWPERKYRKYLSPQFNWHSGGGRGQQHWWTQWAGKFMWILFFLPGNTFPFGGGWLFVVQEQSNIQDGSTLHGLLALILWLPDHRKLNTNKSIQLNTNCIIWIPPGFNARTEWMTSSLFAVSQVPRNPLCTT